MIELMVQIDKEKALRDFSTRLLQAAKDKGLPAHGLGVAIAKALDITPRAAGKYINAEAKPGSANMERLAKFLDVDLAWLALGVTHDTALQMEFGDRLKELTESKKWYDVAKAKMKAIKMSQENLAERLGVTQGAVAHWLSGRRKPDLITINRVLTALDIPQLQASEGSIAEPKATYDPDRYNVLEPWDSSTPLDKDEVEVPFYTDLEVAAGNGIVAVRENDGPKLRFSKSTLRRHGVQPELVACVPVKGDSMEPVIPDGSTIGIDTAKTDIKDGDIYAIRQQELLRVKMLYRLPGNKVRLRSFNQDHDDEVWPIEELTVLGRVFWWSVLR